MKNLKVILTVFALIALGTMASAQTYASDANTLTENLQAKTSLFNIVASQNTPTVGNNNNTSVLQIGDYNKTISVTRSNFSNIQLTQIGNNNDIDHLVSSKNIVEDVIQVGKNHNFTEVSNANSQLHATSVLQYGANQNLIILGSKNSISDRMQVSMQGKDQTVIIRNLNN